MLVETFETQETHCNKEELELHAELARELGLSGQEKVHAAPKTQVFRTLTGEEVFVYSVNFPRLVDIKNYNEGVIPIRVLEVVKRYKEAFPNSSISLMCPDKGEIDPVVIGAQYLWDLQRVNGDCHIIARFGEALEEFSILKDKAMKEFDRTMKGLEYRKLTLLKDIFTLIHTSR